MKESLRSLLAPLPFAAYVTIAVVWWEVSKGQANPLAAFGIDRDTAVHATMLVFLLSFMTCSSTNGKRAGKWLISLIAAICACLAVAFNANGTGPVLLIILAVLLRSFLPLRTALLALVAVNLVVAAEVIWLWDSAYPVLQIALYGGFQGFALMTMHIAQQAEEARDELMLINAELRATRELLQLSARDRERLHIARELHDIAGHGLTALKLTLRGLRDTVRDEDREAVSDALALSDQLLRDIRATVSSLHDTGRIHLKSALERLVAPFEQPVFSIEVADDLVVEDQETGIAAIRAATEAITNVVRHAEARHCRLSVREQGGVLHFVCSDDGRGGAAPADGFGLRGMQERVAALGGAFSIASEPGTGTEVHLQWPIR